MGALIMAYGNGTRARARKTAATTDGRRAQAASLRDKLTQWQADADPGLIAEALARFDGYSERNAMLIAMQDPEATDVSGFKAWIGRGRCVRKGEHGLQILAPAGNGRKGDAEAAPEAGEVGEGEAGEDKDRMFFRLAYVFDVRQTEPLPEADDSAEVDGDA
jgi:hypothetical protein